MEIRTRDGRILESTPDGVPGDPRHPPSQQQLESKFRDCVAFAAKPLAPETIERAIRLIRDLDQVEDMSELIRLFS